MLSRPCFVAAARLSTLFQKREQQVPPSSRQACSSKGKYVGIYSTDTPEQANAGMGRCRCKEPGPTNQPYNPPILEATIPTNHNQPTNGPNDQFAMSRASSFEVDGMGV